MLSALRSKLSYANVMATIARCVALGGSSYAAIALSRNSVQSKHIGKGQVKRSDLGRNAVNSAKVADGSLRPGDFQGDQLPAGPPGPPGPKGDKGDPGPSTGPAGGDLSGSYPNPSIANGAVSPAGEQARLAESKSEPQAGLQARPVAWPTAIWRLQVRAVGLRQ